MPISPAAAQVPAIVDGVSVRPAPGGPVEAATASAGNASNSHQDSSLVVGPSTEDDTVADALQYHLNKSRLAEAHITLESDKEVEDFVDESRWSEKLSKIKSTMVDLSVKAACFIHSMPTRSRGTNVRDKTTRLSLALLLRLVSLATLMIQSAIPYVLISSWPDGEELDVRELDGFMGNPPYLTCFVTEGTCYQVVSNSFAAIDQDNLDAVLNFISTRLTSTTTSGSGAPPCAGNLASSMEENLLRPQVRQPLKLSRKDAVSTRQRENQHAIGGMKDPRKAINMIPGHRTIGHDIAKILESVLASCPRAHEAIHQSIGDHSKKYRGPLREDVQAARKLVEKYFDLHGSGKLGKTQLNQ